MVDDRDDEKLSVLETLQEIARTTWKIFGVLGCFALFVFLVIWLPSMIETGTGF